MLGARNTAEGGVLLYQHMLAQHWLQKATGRFTQAGIGTARLDALVLLEDISGKDRSWLLAHPEHKLSAAETSQLNKLLKKRAAHEPLAYVRGKTEFYGRQFLITPDVLEPRPESETMIEQLKSLSDLPPQPCLADVGTGSGALGITAALELPGTHVELLEADDRALRVAKMNVDKFTLELPCLKTDLLEGSSRRYDVLLCNLPYVPDNFHINLAAAHEPRLAIFGGRDGLQLYRKLFHQIQTMGRRPLYFLSESLPPQHDRLKEIAAGADYRQIAEDDFIQVFRRSET